MVRIFIIQIFFILNAASALAYSSISLPVSFKVFLSDMGIGQNTAIQVNCDWQGANSYYISQLGLDSGTYEIGIMEDGTVLSLDGKLIFSSYAGTNSNIFSINILNNINGQNEYQYFNYLNSSIKPYNNYKQWQGAGSFFIDDSADTFPSGNSISLPVNNSMLNSGGIPMPMFFKINIPDSQLTNFTKVKITNSFAGKEYSSSILPKGGEFLIKIFGNNAGSNLGKGAVRSMDSKLGFSLTQIPVADSMQLSIVSPADNPNGSISIQYKYDQNIHTVKQISSDPSGKIQIQPTDISSFGDTPHFSLPATFKLHLESVTPNTHLHIAQYWRNLYYKTQPGLSKGDYYFRMNQDHSLQSLDGKVLLNTAYSPEPTDKVMAVVIKDVDPDGWSISGADSGKRGHDIIGFQYWPNYNSFQTLSSPGEDSVDVGLGWVPEDISKVYGLVQTTTTPLDVLTKGNYFIQTDADVSGLKLPLPVKIHISDDNTDNKVMVAYYWCQRGFLSQSVDSGDYWIVIYPDGLVESLDRKLEFSEYNEQYIPDKSIIQLTNTTQGAQWASFKYENKSYSMDINYNNEGKLINNQLSPSILSSGNWVGVYSADVSNTSGLSQSLNATVELTVNSPQITDNQTHNLLIKAGGWDGVTVFDVELDIVMPDGTSFQVLNYQDIPFPNIPQGVLKLLSIPVSIDFPKGSYTWEIKVLSNDINKSVIAEDDVNFNIY